MRKTKRSNDEEQTRASSFQDLGKTAEARGKEEIFQNDVSEMIETDERNVATCTGEREGPELPTGARCWNLTTRKPKNGNPASFEPGILSQKELD